MNARTVAFRLGVSPSTLNMWLAADEARAPEDRRFNFHRYRGRKRIWTADAFEALQRAIEAESEPGGCLGGWRNAGDCPRTPDRTAAAQQALARVLGFHPGNERAAERSGPGTPDDGSDAEEAQGCPRL